VMISFSSPTPSTQATSNALEIPQHMHVRIALVGATSKCHPATVTARHFL
jgi:hypothetical protein